MTNIKATTPADAKAIPGFDGKYLVTPGGEVWSIKWGGPRALSTFEGGSGPRVCLWRNNKRYCPDVRTLRRKTFGDDAPAMSNAALRASLLEDYGASSDVLAWLDSLE